MCVCEGEVGVASLVGVGGVRKVDRVTSKCSQCDGGNEWT